MVATTLGSSRDRSYVDRVLFRLRELLLHRLQAFRISGARWGFGFVVSGCYVHVCTPKTRTPKDKNQQPKNQRAQPHHTLPTQPTHSSEYTHTHTPPTGSTAQNLAHVASGRLDCYFDEGGFGGPWDVAAGIVSYCSVCAPGWFVGGVCSIVHMLRSTRPTRLNLSPRFPTPTHRCW